MKIIEINGNLLLGYVLTVNLQHINENVTKILYVFVSRSFGLTMSLVINYLKQAPKNLLL